MNLRSSLMLVSLLAMTPGCASDSARRDRQSGLATPWAEKEKTARPDSAIDPCADRLHELCRPLLMYYAIHRRMPAGLDELRRIAGPDPAIAFECPVSGETYGYAPEGLASPMVKGWIVLFDSTPAHDGRRWGVVLGEIQPGKPLIPRVVPVLERDFPRIGRAPPTQAAPPAPADAPAEP